MKHYECIFACRWARTGWVITCKWMSMLWVNAFSTGVYQHALPASARWVMAVAIFPHHLCILWIFTTIRSISNELWTAEGGKKYSVCLRNDMLFLCFSLPPSRLAVVNWMDGEIINGASFSIQRMLYGGTHIWSDELPSCCKQTAVHGLIPTWTWRMIPANPRQLCALVHIWDSKDLHTLTDFSSSAAQLRGGIICGTNFHRQSKQTTDD